MTQATFAPQRLSEGVINTMSIDEFIACKALNQSSEVGKYYIRGEVTQASIERKINQHRLVQTIDKKRFFLIEEEVTIWVNPNDESEKIVIDGNTRRAAAIYVKNSSDYSDVEFLDVRWKRYTGEMTAQDLYKYQELENNSTEGHSFLQRANAANLLWQEAFDQAMEARFAEKPWKVADPSDDVWRGAKKAASGIASKIVQSQLDISHTIVSRYKAILKLPPYILEHVDNNAIDPVGLIFIVSACEDPKKLKDKYTVEAIYSELRKELKPGQLRVSQNACKNKIEQLVKELGITNTPDSPDSGSDNDPDITPKLATPSDNSDTKKNLIAADDAKLYIDKTVSALQQSVTGDFISDEKISDEIAGIYVKCVDLLNSTKNSVDNVRKRELMPLLRDLMLEFMDSETISKELEADELSRVAHKCGSLTSTIAKAENIIKGVENTSTETITGDDPKFPEKPLEAPLVAENSEFTAELIQH